MIAAIVGDDHMRAMQIRARLTHVKQHRGGLLKALGIGLTRFSTIVEKGGAQLCLWILRCGSIQCNDVIDNLTPQGIIISKIHSLTIKGCEYGTG